LELARRQTNILQHTATYCNMMQHTKGEERTTLNVEDNTVVIPKKRRYRGASRQKILIKWRNYAFPYIYSELLTPATLIEDIDRNPRTSSEALAKATLTPPNNLMTTLHLHTPLHIQGVVAVDTLTLVIRHSKICDPYDVQHFKHIGRRTPFYTFLLHCGTLLPFHFGPNLSFATKSSPLTPPADFRTVTFLMSLPSMCTLVVIRTLIHT